MKDINTPLTIHDPFDNTAHDAACGTYVTDILAFILHTSTQTQNVEGDLTGANDVLDARLDEASYVQHRAKQEVAPCFRQRQV